MLKNIKLLRKIKKQLTIFRFSVAKLAKHISYLLPKFLLAPDQKRGLAVGEAFSLKRDTS